MGMKIQQRLLELADADTLGDMSAVVTARCHALVANLKGQFDGIGTSRSLDLPASR